jgi:hypothetical protein
MLEIEISNNPHIDRIILSIDRSPIFCCNLYDKYISLIILIHVYIYNEMSGAMRNTNSFSSSSSYKGNYYYY